MAESDWDLLDNSVSDVSIARGVTAGITPAGGTFAYGFNTLTSVVGSVGLKVNAVDFDPMAKGGQITGAVQRGAGPADTGFVPMLFLCLGGTDVTDQGYLLGLSNAEPARIILRKGGISGGIPDLTPNPTANGNLLASTETFAKGTWVHLRLDAIVNDNGDVVLKVFQNDLDANPVTAPVWVTPAGMQGPQSPSIVGFVDDALQVNTGSAPFLAGRAGFATAITTGGPARRCFFDHLTVARQV